MATFIGLIMNSKCQQTLIKIENVSLLKHDIFLMILKNIRRASQLNFREMKNQSIIMGFRTI